MANDSMDRDSTGRLNRKHTPKSGKTSPKFDDALWEKLCEECKFKPKLRDLAGILDCDIRTIEREIFRRTGKNFVEFRSEKMGPLRQTLVKLALQRSKASDAVLIFTLKNLCGWSDRIIEMDADDVTDIDFVA